MLNPFVVPSKTIDIELSSFSVDYKSIILNPVSVSGICLSLIIKI